MRRTIAARQMVTAGGVVAFPLLTVEDGLVASVRGMSAEEFERFKATYRFPDGVLAPAYVDVHIHGCAGYDVMEASPEALRAVGAGLARHGVGAYLATTVTSAEDATLRALAGLTKEIARAEMGGDDGGAMPLGIHLEGPFLSAAKRGVHAAALLQAPSVAGFRRLWEAAEGRILLMTIAPELQGAPELIAEATALGVRCSLGHTDAVYGEARAGFAAGARSATHTFNAMRRLDHRDPGVTAFVLEEDRLFAEIIADGLHVDPVMVRLFYKAKGPERTILVTDGISATGMPDGRYKLGEMEVDVVEGRCMANGAIAGSTLTMDRGVRNLMQFTGAELGAAVGAASWNPARMLGKDDEWGALEAGRPANVAVLSATGEVLEMFVQGRPLGSNR